tara:strand:- start:782 stop:991 length:210 start_codon:yes stop_codon:yes gene_type:complete
MTYKGCTITRAPAWDTPHGIRKVYAIEGAVDKPAARRPYLTSIRAAKEYISHRVNINKEIRALREYHIE